MCESADELFPLANSKDWALVQLGAEGLYEVGRLKARG